MGASAAILFPVVEDVGAAIGGALGFGGEAAAAAEVSPELAALYTAAEAPLPAVVGDMAAGTFEFAPAAEAAAAAAPLAAEAAGAAAPAADLSYLPIQTSAAGAPVAATDAAAGTGALGSSGTAVGNALAGTSPVTTGIGSVASSVAPTTEAAASTLPVTESTDLSYLPIQQSAAGTPIPATNPLAGAGSLGSSGTSVGNALAGGTASPLTPLSGADPSVTSALQPTLNDASSSAAQTLGGQPGQEISKDLSRLGSPAVTNTAVDQAPVAATTTPAAPATPATPAAAPVAPAAAAPAATEAITPTTDALSGAGGTSNLVKGATDAGGDGLLGGVKSFMKDYGSLALGGAGLAYNMLKGNEPVPYSAQLESQAAQLQAQGAQLQGYLSSGTLPPGIGAALQGAHDSAAASIRAQYASRGMSGSSAEMQDLANLAQTTVSQGANIASSLLSTGVSEQQFASGLYQNLMAQSVAQDTAMSNAMAGFTNAMAGGYAKKAAPVG